MQYTFGELQNEFFFVHNLTKDIADAAQLTTCKLRINEIQDRIQFRNNYEFRKRTFYFTLKAPYSTGTISVTKGSATVTGSSTVWTSDMRIGYLLVNGKAYKVKAVASNTSLSLMGAFPETSISAGTYSIVFPDVIVPTAIQGIVNAKVAGIDVDVVSKDKLSVAMAGTGLPSQCAIGESYFEDWYKTGTVEVMNASAVVTGSATAFSSEMEGMEFRVDEFSRPYIIKSVDSSTQITLWETYDGSSGSGKSYKIGAKGSPVLTFRTAPNDYFWVEVEAIIAFPKMINDNDVSPIPQHAALISGVRWMAHDLKNENPVRIEQLSAEFKKACKDLDDSYKSVVTKWISNDEIQRRKGIRLGLNDANPF